MGQRAIICGGRDWSDRDITFRALDEYHRQQPIAVVIHGAAKGADTLAGQWAKSRRIPVLAFPVSRQEWRTVGRSAGHLRNRKMLDRGKPDVVIAFPGGAGTKNMKRIAREAGIPVTELR